MWRSALILLPLYTCIALWISLTRRINSRRDAALAAAVIVGVLITAVTEIASLFRALTPAVIVTTWALTAVAATITCQGQPFKPLPRPHWSLACIAVIVLPTFVVAVFAAPNNWDSMSYHLARSANWIQHGTVAFYPTNITRQLYLAPFAEFAVTNLMLLTGDDRPANLVQFAAMMMCLIAVSAVAKQLGAPPAGQGFAAVFAATLPIGILEASSTQTDFVAALWLIVFIYFGLRCGATRSPWPTIASAAALGLGVLTKTTIILFATPFLFWFAFISARRVQFLIAMLLIPMINAGHWARCFQTFGNALGPPAETALYKNDLHTPAAIASTLLRDLASNLGIPGYKNISTVVGRAIAYVTGLDSSDPRITHGPRFQFKFSTNEDLAGNCLAVVVIAIAGCALSLTKPIPEYPKDPATPRPALRRTSLRVRASGSKTEPACIRTKILCHLFMHRLVSPRLRTPLASLDHAIGITVVRRRRPRGRGRHPQQAPDNPHDHPYCRRDSIRIEKPNPPIAGPLVRTASSPSRSVFRRPSRPRRFNAASRRPRRLRTSHRRDNQHRQLGIRAANHVATHRRTESDSRGQSIRVVADVRHR